MDEKESTRMREITVEEWQELKPGTVVETGYAGKTLTAPKEEGLWTLYEIASESNTHLGWKWVKS